MLKAYRPLIIAGLLGFSFFWTGYFSLNAYSRYDSLSERRVHLTRQRRTMLLKKGEFVHKNQILSEMQNFLDRAKSLNLQKDKWAVYEVNVQDTMSFAEAQQVLSQCAYSTFAYYVPALLEIKTIDSSKTDLPGAQKKGDLFITLRGRFVARQQ